MPAKPIVLRPRLRPSGVVELVMSFILVWCVVTLSLLILCSVLGRWSWLVERSDSMAPVLRAGDLLAVQRISPAMARPRDIVTFKEPSRPGILITHRVVSVIREGDHYEFVTQGDANNASETWSVKADGSIGRLVLRIPYAGRVVSLLAQPRARFLLLTVASVLLAFELLRRIWARDDEVRTMASPKARPNHQKNLSA